jgi:hypothetical protein
VRTEINIKYTTMMQYYFSWEENNTRYPEQSQGGASRGSHPLNPDRPVRQRLDPRVRDYRAGGHSLSSALKPASAPTFKGFQSLLF